jgi:hypothetical protein
MKRREFDRIAKMRYRLLFDFSRAVTVRSQEFNSWGANHLQDGRSPWRSIAIPFRELETHSRAENALGV